MKRLIVTADDVGLHEGMTLGAVRAHREGIVTACSLAATGEAFSHAVEQLRECPALEVGVHLTLVDARPLLPPAQVPSLVAGGGRFASGYRTFLARYALGRLSAADVERELRAQVARIVDANLAPSHLNSHQHLHLLPGLFEIVTRIALEHRIPYVRIVDDRGPWSASPPRRAAIACLSQLGRRARARAAAAGLRTNTATVGVACAGHLDSPRLIEALACVEGLTELVAHPGVNGRGIASAYGWSYDWDAETSALCGPAPQRAVERNGITLSGVRRAVNGAAAGD